MGKRLTIEQKDLLCELRLNGVPVRQVAKQVGCAPNTVTDVYHRWLAERRAEDDSLAIVQSELIQSHRRAARISRKEQQAAEQSGDLRSLASFLDQERASLNALAKLTGADAPAKFDSKSTVDVNLADLSEEELRRLIDGE